MMDIKDKREIRREMQTNKFIQIYSKRYFFLSNSIKLSYVRITRAHTVALMISIFCASHVTPSIPFLKQSRRLRAYAYA